MTVRTITPDELFSTARSFVEDLGKLRDKKRSKALTEEEVRRAASRSEAVREDSEGSEGVPLGGV
jgi:hypothetical protein